MTKPLRDLLLDLDELNREIHRARHKEISSDTMAARFPQSSVKTRERLRALLAAPPQRRGITASEHRAQLFEWVRNLAKAWGGVCVTPAYQGRYVPFDFECAAGHRFSMLMHGLWLGHWCRTCAVDRTKYSLDHARALAVKHGGQCLSDCYSNNREQLRWRCKAGHTWLASLENVSRGHWCKVCRVLSIKPSQRDIERAAMEHRGRCLPLLADGQPNKTTGPRVATGHPSPDGSMRYSWNLTPTSLTDLVQLKLQPIPVLPIIFVPGIMGSNLKSKPNGRGMGDSVWRLDDTAGFGKPIAMLPKLAFKNAGERQSALNPGTTVVDDEGALPSHLVGSIRTLLREVSARCISLLRPRFASMAPRGRLLRWV